MPAARAIAVALLALAPPAALVPLSAQTPTPGAPNPLAVPSRTPVVRVTLSGETLVPGDRVRVRVRTRDAGYLLVVQADPAGRVRVLFPLDPDDDQDVRGGAEIGLPSHGGRDSFIIGSATGDGAVLAAVSADPFRVAEFARGGHWDVRAFPRLAAGADAEGELVAVAEQMTDRDAQFDYDIAPYRVGEAALPIVVSGGEPYDSDAYAMQPAPAGYAPGGYAPGGYAPGGYAPGGYAPGGYAPGGYFYDVLFGYGAPFYAGVLPFPFWHGAFRHKGFRHDGFRDCSFPAAGGGLRIILAPGCFGAGFSSRHHPFGPGGSARRPRPPRRPIFVGNPDFGEPGPPGVIATGPRAIAGGRRPGALPRSANGGGIVFRTRAPIAPRAPAASPTSGLRAPAATPWMAPPAARVEPPRPQPRAYDVVPMAPAAAPAGGTIGVRAAPPAPAPRTVQMPNAPQRP